MIIIVLTLHKKIQLYYLVRCYLRVSTRNIFNDFPLPKHRCESLRNLLLKSESHPAILKHVHGTFCQPTITTTKYRMHMLMIYLLYYQKGRGQIG